MATSEGADYEGGKMKPKVIVVCHSATGRTAKLAEAIARGASGEVMAVNNVDWEKLHAADAIIFGSPTYMGGVSGALKTFMDETGKYWVAQKWKNKVAGGFTNASYSSGDKLSALMQIAVFAAQHSMIWVGSDSMPEEDINRMGSYLGVMSQSLTKTPPDKAMNVGDLKTGELYGKRIAEIAAKLR